MHANLNRAVQDIEKVNGIGSLISKSFAEIEVRPETLEEMDCLQNAFYAMMDEVQKVREDIALLAEDSQIVDVIMAVKRKGK